jgi:hypothetical protein
MTAHRGKGQAVKAWPFSFQTQFHAGIATFYRHGFETRGAVTPLSYASYARMRRAF